MARRRGSDLLLATPLARDSGDSYIDRMSIVDSAAAGEGASEEEINARRRAAAIALGLDPAAIAWPDRHEEHDPASGDTEVEWNLRDEDWRVLEPLLPAEAPQVQTMSNREFLSAVLEAMRRNGWSSRSTPATAIEAVRRRFGRWAHQGVFEAIGAALTSLDLAPETKRLLALACRRAGRIKANAKQ